MAWRSQDPAAEDDATMATNWDSDMKERFDRLDTKVSGLQIEVEKLRDDVKNLGKLYEAGWRQIAREIRGISKNWDMKWSPHDLAIKDRGKRITVLERRVAKP